MEQQLFTNEIILSWLQYFAKNTPIDLEKVKMLDITRKNKNVIPTVETHRAVLVFTEAGNPDIFYRMWNAGLGDCDVWYNEGSEPVGEVKCDKVCNMINRGINASAGMLVINPNACNTYKIGMDNQNFRRGSIHYVGSEIRSVIFNKMQIGRHDDICVISGESIAIEAGLIATEGSVLAVEYNQDDRATMEDNIDHFGLQNINVVDHVDAETLQGLPVPSLVFLVASASTEQEIACLTALNPKISVVVYTLDFAVAAGMPKLFEKYGIEDAETIQVSVSRLTAKNSFEQEPAPWIISGKANASV
ncbi:MAG: precorrin-6B methylase [Clostridiales bacterium]|nr:precorrin-6B methylase [Clostridiales bacterium]